MSLGDSIGSSLGRAIGSSLSAGGDYVDIVREGVLAGFVTFTRASSGTYYDSAGVLQTASTDVPRIDYDPSTLALRGLLIEEARTNVLRLSQCDLYFNANGTTPPTKADSVTHLGVSCTSALFTAAMTSTGYSGCRLDRNTGSPEARASITAGVQYTYSLYIALSRPLVSSESITYYWTGVAGTPTTVVINAANSADYVGAFVRCVITDTPGLSGTNFPAIYLSGAMSSDLSVYITRGGCEAGAFATSYIPTTSAAVTRARDVATVTDLTSIGYNSAGTTLYADISSLFLETPGTSIGSFAVLNDGTSNNVIRGYRYLLKFGGHVAAGGVLSADRTCAYAVAINELIKYAFAAATNSAIVANNGVASAEDTTVVIPVVTRMDVGGTAGLGYWNGHIRNLRYYPRRLSDAELVALTA